MAEATLKARLDQAIKQALLGGDSFTATALRGLKSAILYAEVAAKKRDEGLNDTEIQAVLAKEAKKRQESADLYTKGGRQELADTELREKALIETFLPAQISDEELTKLVDDVVAANPEAQMGQLIGLVKQQAGPGADGGRIAALVRARISA